MHRYSVTDAPHEQTGNRILQRPTWSHSGGTRPILAVAFSWLALACGSQDSSGVDGPEPNVVVEVAAEPEGPVADARHVEAAVGDPAVLENRPAESTTGSVTLIGDTPSVSIGNQETGIDLFRVSGATRLSDGRIVVADASRRVHVFDASGGHLESFGGRGQGPGEFNSITWIQRLPGDSLAVYDLQMYRLSYFSPDGELVRTFQFPAGPPRILGVFADGTLLTGSTAGPIGPSGFAMDGVVIQTHITLNRRDRSGAVLDSLGTVPGSEQMRPRSTSPMPVVVFPTFRSTRFALGASHVYIATGHRFEVQVAGPDEPLRIVARAPFEARPMGAADLLRSMPGLGLNEQDVSLPPDQTFPATRALILDALGNIWVEEFPLDPLDPAPPGKWVVFSPAGARIADVPMPSRFTPREIGVDWVLGIWRDDLDVEHVEIRTITRTP